MNQQLVPASWLSMIGAVVALLQPELFIAACLALTWWRGQAARQGLPTPAAGTAMLETP